MRVHIDYKDVNTSLQNIRVNSAEYLSDFVIRLHFNDGSEKVVDFKPFLSKSSHPSIKQYLDENKFSSFKIIDGNINWNDYELIFPIWDLYKGNI